MRRRGRAAGYRVVRHPGTLMLPVPAVDRRMRRLIAEHDIDTVWFGAAAPLALLAQRARQAGATRVLASTHGHEVGWSMLPVARSVLRRIGDEHRRRDVRQPLHPVAVRAGLRACGVARVPAARGGHRPVPARPGRARRAARPLPAGGAAHRGVPVAAGAAQGPGRADQGAAVDPASRRRRRAGDRRRRSVPGDAARAGPRLRRGRRRDVHRRACRATNCPRTTRWPTCSRCRAAPAAGAWTSRAWASCSWRPRPPACRWSPATRVGPRKPCSTTRLGWSSTAARWTRSPTPSTELLTDRDRAAAMGAAGRRVGDVPVALGHAGRPAGRAARDRAAGTASPCCRSPRSRRRTSRPPRCA